MSTDSELLGIVLLARHGDRMGRYQNPETYTATATAITPLGEKQEFMLGEFLRQTYFNSSSPSYIPNFSGSETFNTSQTIVRADASGDVIVDSCEAVVQGLWPANDLAESIMLANGTMIVSPLGGYQYVPIESVEPNEDVSLEGYTSCNTLTTRTTNFYNSSTFLAKSIEAEPFFLQLQPYVNGRSVSLENMWNIFDYLNVQYTHNATFAQLLPYDYLEQARALANWHEYNVFSDPEFNGIGNIGWRSMAPSIISAMQDITNSTNGLKMHYSAIAYINFISLFNMTGLIDNNYITGGIVDYAAAAVFEIRQPSDGSEPVIRFQYKNGTDDSTLHNYPLSLPGWSGSGDVPVSTFVNAFQPVAVNSTLDWCKVCGQETLRGCSQLLAATPTPLHQKISPVGAGFLGAGLTVAVLAALFGTLLALGLLSLGGKRRRDSGFGRHNDDDHFELRSEVGSIKAPITHH